MEATGSITGAGIGGGGNYTTAVKAIPGNGGKVIINGGKVCAVGGSEGYGIGPGRSRANVDGEPGTLELGWLNKNDQIYTSSVKASVTLNSKFTYAGTQTVVTADNVGGAILLPYIDNNLKVEYINASGSKEWLNEGSYTLITNQTELNDGWYVVNNNVTIDTRISIMGNVHLVLADDCSLTLPKGISLMREEKLHIYGQTAGTGSLTAGPGDDDCAGIGGMVHDTSGMLEVNGGTVTATAGKNAAGIGGGGQGNWSGGWGHGGTVVINGGTVKATGNGHGAGIGGGSNYINALTAIPGSGGIVVINGGTVIAIGGDSGYGIGSGKSPASGIEGETGTLYLSWRDLTDRIYISSTNSDVTIDKDFIHADTGEAVMEDNVGGFVLVPEEMNKHDVVYIGEDGTEKILYGGTYTTIHNQTELKDGWYVLNRDRTIDERISITGNVHLVQTDNHTFKAPGGIRLLNGDELHIYGQSGGTGSLIAGPASDWCAGIGGDIHDTGGTLVVNGGNVTATAGKCASGIGGGAQGNWKNPYGHGGTVVINGGTVTATGNSYGAGIGGGGNHLPSTEAIPGNGGSVTINGGSVTAIGGDNGYGIGPGNSPSNTEGEPSTLLLSWRNKNDSIYISSAQADITFDRTFGVSGTNERATKENINGNIIVPARAIIINDDQIEFGKLISDKEVCTYESEEDETVTLNAIPDEGYRTRGVTISGASSIRVDENTFTFTMPSSDANVSASFYYFTMGDVNCDGTIDISDIVAIIHTMAGDDLFKYTADVNGDGKTDISDVVAVINIMAGT